MTTSHSDIAQHKAHGGHLETAGAELLADAQRLLKQSKDRQAATRAFQMFNRAVEHGAKDAHPWIARMHLYGLGTRLSIPKAIHHFGLAARSGDHVADGWWRWLIALEGVLWHRGDRFSTDS